MITIKNEFEVGEIVFDELTGEKVRLVGITFQRGKKGKNSLSVAMDTIGYWVDNNYLGGGRVPWEISSVKAYKCTTCINYRKQSATPKNPCYVCKPFGDAKNYKEIK